ncbi:hypothetical protein A3A63_03355 [Candidatus Gottesmanbacteria bacterium RIFCSPLOWO2_01_FULL_46_9]|uniref:Uncharacterized protein n=1 Tax=Candidatus Gottesmanbacteria bacterium RIFCSPLOWO2_01_FULL_46_9 TaxID=1798394 RepID=A0A1F6AYU3_9BACT|nr:MAG: hypothetical protein A3A63_03355 [Candidatus Gottesmanbacteria bacterium RIFCSPLOWO2_01_FULL_46_9]
MDGPGITYAFLIIPSFFAVVVVLQGVEKLAHHNKEGYVALGFGVFFFILIAAAYVLFIR